MPEDALASLTGQVADVVTASAIVVAGAVWLATRSWRSAVPVLLELLVAAVLLRLTGTDSWGAIAAAGAVVGIRLLVGTGIGAHALSGDGSGDRRARGGPSS